MRANGNVKDATLERLHSVSRSCVTRPSNAVDLEWLLKQPNRFGWLHRYSSQRPTSSQGRIEGVGLPLKTYESNFIHHNFVQFGKQHSWYVAILSSIVLLQQCCEVYFTSLTVAKLLWDLTTNY